MDLKDSYNNQRDLAGPVDQIKTEGLEPIGQNWTHTETKFSVGPSTSYSIRPHTSSESQGSGARHSKIFQHKFSIHCLLNLGNSSSTPECPGEVPIHDKNFAR